MDDFETSVGWDRTQDIQFDISSYFEESEENGVVALPESNPATLIFPTTENKWWRYRSSYASFFVNDSRGKRKKKIKSMKSLSHTETTCWPQWEFRNEKKREQKKKEASITDSRVGEKNTRSFLLRLQTKLAPLCSAGDTDTIVFVDPGTISSYSGVATISQ